MAEEVVVSKSVGTILREAREAKGLSLKNIEYATNIHEQSLQYLENDEYDKTPGEFFTKGAIRTYGNYLGLDGTKLVNMYKASKSGQSIDSVEAKGIREAAMVSMKLQLKNQQDIGSGGREKHHLPKISWAKVGLGVGALVVAGSLYFAIPMVMQWIYAPSATDKAAEPVMKPAPEEQAKTEIAKPVAPNAVTPTAKAATPSVKNAPAVRWKSSAGSKAKVPRTTAPAGSKAAKVPRTTAPAGSKAAKVPQTTAPAGSKAAKVPQTTAPSAPKAATVPKSTPNQAVKSSKK